MYAEGYKNAELARATYKEIPSAFSASACTDCSICVARCVNGLNIPAKMVKARKLLA
jgi:predicted aldo/keto reductase-like oxidoreductase